MTGRAAASAAMFGCHIADDSEKPWVSSSGVAPSGGPKVW
jgi:hypothetical protein